MPDLAEAADAYTRARDAFHALAVEDVDVRTFTRFWNYVQMDANGCWLWTATTDHLGYGHSTRILGEVRVHRITYRLFCGSILDGMCVMHMCDVRNCCNPAHLKLGTPTDNMRDMVRKGRWRGPDVSGENNSQAKLTRETVAEIRQRSAAGATGRELAKQFGVAPMTISRAIRGESWK